MDEDDNELQEAETRADGPLSGGIRRPMSPLDIDDTAQEMPSDIVDPDLDRRTKRKLDFILLPFLALLFLFNSLDKSNIGTATSSVCKTLHTNILRRKC